MTTMFSNLFALTLERQRTFLLSLFCFVILC